MLDGLLYHESDLEIREHYTDTAGFTDHVFALMHLLGFAFCPRIRDLHDKKLFIKGKADQYPALQSLISTTSLNLKEIEIHWREVLRLATSIKQGTVTASLMLKKLASYPKQNGLAKALREIGRIERKRAARTVLTGMCYSVGSATRQGSSSLTRFIGQSAMTSRT